MSAFDANYGKYSPGALLVDRITDQLFAGSGVQALNSCAVEASFSDEQDRIVALASLPAGAQLTFKPQSVRFIASPASTASRLSATPSC